MSIETNYSFDTMADVQLYNACILHLLIKQIREGVVIVSVQWNKLHLHVLIKQIRKGVAILSEQFINYIYTLTC